MSLYQREGLRRRTLGESGENGGKKVTLNFNGFSSQHFLERSHNKARRVFNLKDPSQPLPFLTPWKLSILHGAAKSEFFTIGFVLESTFNYL